MKRLLTCILIVLLAVGIFFGISHLWGNPEGKPVNGPTPNTQPPQEAQPENISITLYFADPTASGLISEQRNVEVLRTQLPQRIVEELIKGPETDGLIAAINKGTLLHSVQVTHGIALVDFGSNLEPLNTGGSSRERLCLYALVNSLTELPEITAVKIAVDGKLLEFFGQIELSDPIVRNTSLILLEK